MIDADSLAQRFAEFLGAESDARLLGSRIALLTPAEYPDLDAVAVYVQQRPDGAYAISDLATADSLLAGHVNPRAATRKGQAVAERFDVSFDRGSVVATANEEALPEACWRVAQASAAIAEALSFAPPAMTPRREFDALVAGVIEERGAEVERNRTLVGLSGHEHSASLYVPASEAVVEPVAGRKAWERATKVYAEFGDLGQVNGYQLVAVLDDRDADLSKEANLLSQVGHVAAWSRHDDWIAAVTAGRQS